MAGPTKCKLQASIGTCTPHRKTNQNNQGQPGNKEAPATHHPAHHRAQGKGFSPPRQGTRITNRTTQIQMMPMPTQGQPPTSAPEGNIRPPQHSDSSQNT
ncbi:hypothetical protein AMECASPLE_039464 [Ameca splendens]|uniref:Uncharacterized protein n=1 Tax=Ameca splendens TaxID=208324 RepID=A0ABV1AGD8_9TELE